VQSNQTVLPVIFRLDWSNVCTPAQGLGSARVKLARASRLASQADDTPIEHFALPTPFMAGWPALGLTDIALRLDTASRLTVNLSGLSLRTGAIDLLCQGGWKSILQEGLKLTSHAQSLPSSIEHLEVQIDRPEGLEDIGYMTCMTLVLLGNYAQTGHFGGPLAYTPYNVAAHLAGPVLGGLRYDYRRPKHPFGDKFMLAGGHNIPTGYALLMIMGQALQRKFEATDDPRYYVDPNVAILPIDALGFRRGAGALKNLLQDHSLADHPLFAQAKARGIKALAGHAESTDVTNDVNGGPSGIGIATAAGKAAFWNIIGAPSSLKVIALEGEFALSEGHAQELKTQALALQVGKRLRLLLSYNNAGIDDVLLGGVVDQKFDSYRIADQWTS